MFLAPTIAAGGDPAPIIAPLVQWYQVASTNIAGLAPTTQINAVTPGNPAEAAKLDVWLAIVRGTQMAYLRVGGPGLTNAAFTAGVTNVTNTLQATNQATIDYHQDATVKTFTDKHGPSLGQCILNLCNVADEADLPEVHTALVHCPKSREYTVITALFAERADTTDLPISLANVPLATMHLVDNVFHSYIPGGTGLTFGKGLPPFSIMCKGHKEATGTKTSKKGILPKSNNLWAIAHDFTVKPKNFSVRRKIHRN